MGKKIVAFCCENSSFKAADSVADPSVLQQVDLVRLPCSGMTEAAVVLRCLEKGHPAVLILGCPTDACKYLRGNLRARRRVAHLRATLEEAGLDPQRVRMELLSSVDSHKFSRVVQEMAGRLGGAGAAWTGGAAQREPAAAEEAGAGARTGRSAP